LTFEHEPLAKSLRFSGSHILVDLVDGRTISIPLAHYPTLKNMPAGHRSKWEVIGPGVGFHWAEYDLDLSVRGFLEGRREHVPAASYRLKHPRPIDRKSRARKWPILRSSGARPKASRAAPTR
jgi:hypothetical protein